MGCGKHSKVQICQVEESPPPSGNEVSSISRQWMLLPSSDENKRLFSSARGSSSIKFVTNVSEDPSRVEFRTVMDIPVAREFFLKYLKKNYSSSTLEIFNCWMEIQDFRIAKPDLPISDMTFSMCMKHVDQRNDIRSDLLHIPYADINGKTERNSYFDELQISCFLT